MRAHTSKNMHFISSIANCHLNCRQNSDLDNLRNLFDEATFYDRQWNATWDNVKRPSENKE